MTLTPVSTVHKGDNAHRLNSENLSRVALVRACTEPNLFVIWNNDRSDEMLMLKMSFGKLNLHH